MSTSTATKTPAGTILPPVETLNRSTYTVPLPTGHVVNMVFAMPLHHRIGMGDSGRVRPISTFITRPEYKTVSIGKAAQILIDDVVEAVVDRENKSMESLGIKPIHAHDKGRYEREFGYMDLDRLIECLILEREFELSMEGAHGIAELYITRDSHDDIVHGLHSAAEALKNQLDAANEKIEDQEDVARAERIVGAITDLKLHGEKLFDYRPGKTMAEKFLDYLEDVSR